MNSNILCLKLCLVLSKDPVSVACYHPQQVSLSFLLSEMGIILAPTHKRAVGQLYEMKQVNMKPGICAQSSFNRLRLRLSTREW